MASYLITGCSRGIGLELTKLLADSSGVSTVFATARSKTPALDSVINSSNGRIHFIPLDVTSDNSVSSAVSAVTSRLNGAGLDVLVNNAGIQIPEPSGSTKMHSLEETLQVNTIAVHRVSSAFLPLLEKGKLKKLLIVSSELGSMTNKDYFALAPFPSYKISKAATNMLMVQYAIELKPKGFTVFCVSPGWLKTDLGGPAADLEPVVGAKEVLRILDKATPEDNGKFKQIFPTTVHVRPAVAPHTTANSSNTASSSSHPVQALSSRALEKQPPVHPHHPIPPIDPTAIDDSQLRHLAPTLHRPEPPLSQRPPSVTAIEAQATRRRSFLEAFLARQPHWPSARQTRGPPQRILYPLNHVPRPVPVRIDQRSHLPPGAEPGTGEVHTLLTLPEQRRSRQYSPTHIEHSPQLSSAAGSRTSIGLPPNQRRASQIGSVASHAEEGMGDAEKPSTTPPEVPAKDNTAAYRFRGEDTDLEAQHAPSPSILGSNYGLNPSDQPAHPPRRVSSQKSLKSIKRIHSSRSIRSSLRRVQVTNNEAPPPIPPKFGSTADLPADDGDLQEELAWGPAHPCFPHLNPHVASNSPEYESTRVIRIKRDWMVVGDLAPTFSNIYPEILDPLLSEQEFRYIIQHVNTTLIHAFDPFSAANWFDGILGLLTGWFWEDFRPSGVKGKLRRLERWIETWNRDVGSHDGVKLISLRRTAYMSLDIQIPDPRVKVVGEEDDPDRPPGTMDTANTTA
ncbi:hypothetical protein DV736_g1335, partial [Chaetothyriales sp. CBS 134916]